MEYISRLRSEFPDAPVRWEKPDKLHITVKFAGSLDEAHLSTFSDHVKAAANAAEPFTLKIVGAGAFVKRRGPSVLWLRVDQISPHGDPLGKTAAMLDGVERRPFHPHITIARIKEAKKAKDLIEKHSEMNFESAAFEVNELVIYESKLLPSGSVYSKIASFPLGGDITK